MVEQRLATWVSAYLLGALQRSRLLRPVLIAVPAVVTGLLLAPDLTGRSYPTAAALVGTPAAENIKAPFDIDVVDVATTDRLRLEAEASVLRVYEQDVQLADRIADQIDDAFSFARAAYVGDRSGVRDGWRDGFEERLGVRLKAGEFEVLVNHGFSSTIEASLAGLVAQTMAHPIVASRRILETDATRGLAIQLVPGDGSAPRVVTRLEDIFDLGAAQGDVASRTAGTDLRSLRPGDRDLLASVAASLVRPNLTLSRAATELARQRSRDAVTPAMITMKKGEMIVRDGERISARQLMILQALSKTSRRASASVAALGAALLVLIVVLVGVAFGRAQPWGGAVRPVDLIFLSLLFAGTAVGMRLWVLVSQALQDAFGAIPLQAYLYAMPVAAAALMTRLVLRTDVALLVAVLIGLVAGLIVPGPAAFPLYVIVGSTFGVTLLRRLTARGGLTGAGVRMGLVQAAIAMGAQMYGASVGLVDYLAIGAAAFVGGLVSALLVLALTPAVEALFGYTTDLKLLELANLNHPALKDLLVQAPGSYHHSVVVASLVEAAAEAIGANPLLGRVMAYYHDLGKGCNPGYFIENQRGTQNPHDKLKPPLSAMIIRRHVSDGLEIARRYGLGEPVIAGIEQHHGSTLIHYFYSRAKEIESEEGGNAISESDYRYPGRKPQTREAALVMLGDSVEAAARSLPDPTPARLQGLVNRIINLKFTDGQLEECDLTLRDLHTIAKSFTRVINAIYHQRVEYPELLGELAGGTKRSNADSDQKPTKPAESTIPPDSPERPDNLRRLGLS